MKELWDGLWLGGTRGSTEYGVGGLYLFILSGVLWLGSTHISCPLFSDCQSPCSPKLVCLLMDYLGERVYPFIPSHSEYAAHPIPPESPHLSTPAWPWGAVIKRWRGLELVSGGAGLGHWQGFAGGLLLQRLWGLARISWRLVVIDSIWDAFLSASRLWPVHMLASSNGP